MKILKYSLVLFTMVMIIGIYSCSEDDPCEGVVCTNGGCDNGSCVCDDGYTGADCSEEIRAQYIGIWSGPNDCNAPLPQFDEFIPEEISLEIAAGPDNVLDLEMTLNIMTGMDMPDPMGQIVRLDGNAFVLEDTSFEIPTIGDINIGGDGIFRSNGELSFDYAITAEVEFGGMMIPINVPCEATLVKEE